MANRKYPEQEEQSLNSNTVQDSSNKVPTHRNDNSSFGIEIKLAKYRDPHFVSFGAVDANEVADAREAEIVLLIWEK